MPDALVAALDAEGIELVIDDADKWIPDKTGFAVDKGVTKAMNKAAQGFDCVHAWGLRAAWAASEAFYLRFPWVYTAYDEPKSTHSELVDRLNAARRGLCSSPFVKERLDAADTLNLEVAMPGVAPPEDLGETTRDAARKQLGIRDDAKLVVACGRFVADRGFEALTTAFEDVRRELPDATLLLSGAGPEPPPIHQDGVDVRGPLASVWPALCAADLVVVPSTRAGFSLFGAEAMWAGTPVLYRNTGGLRDMAENGSTAFFFDLDVDLAPRIVEILESDLTRETVANAGNLRAHARYKLERYARETAQVYREAVGA